jgi:hypothetical protein
MHAYIVSTLILHVKIYETYLTWLLQAVQCSIQDTTAKYDYTTYDTWTEIDTISYSLNDTENKSGWQHKYSL